MNVVLAGNEIWPMDRPDGMPSINSLEVMCGKDHMDVHMSFSHPFEGIVSSKGQHSDPRCVYIPPSTGKKFFSFRIAYGRCGTKPDLNGQFYENTVSKIILFKYLEHFHLSSCFEAVKLCQPLTYH